MAADIKRRTIELYGDSPSGKMGPVRISVPADMVRRNWEGPEIVILDFFYDGNIDHLTPDTVLSPREVVRLAPMYDTQAKAWTFAVTNQFALTIKLNVSDVAMLFRPGVDKGLGTDPQGRYNIYELFPGGPRYFQPVDDLQVVYYCDSDDVPKCELKTSLSDHVFLELSTPRPLFDEWRTLQKLVQQIVVIQKY